MVVPYYGGYLRFAAETKAQGTLLLGADCLVGDTLSVVFENEDGHETAWLENRFGERCGRLDAQGAGRAKLCNAKGWCMRVLLASVYGSSEEDGIGYWGEVVLLGFPASHADAFGAFADGIADLLARGARPDVDLHQSSLSQILETKGAWQPSARVNKPQVDGSVLVKDHVSFKEQLVEAARRRNPGCMFAGWAFIAFLAAGFLWLVRGLLGV